MTSSKQPIDELTQKLKRTELQHKASSIPGREIVQVLTEIPARVESGWHQHPGEEVGYILAESAAMRIKGQPTLTLHAGERFLMPPPHAARRPGPRSRDGHDAVHLHRGGGAAACDIHRRPRPQQ
jgi:quercetin dioxygenase-like cupin family protein